MRILALDWGTVRVGGAISDPDGKIAFPLDKFFQSKQAVNEIRELINEKSVDKVLVGLPTNLAGEETEATRQAQAFIQELGNKIPCPIETVDERLSSVGAQKSLSASGVSQKQQRDMVDNLAAQHLLQSYLDSQNQ
jgi:putative Holliday junction resolvase